MARVTVEDCLEFVDNRFDLVLLAAKRARRIARDEVVPKIEAGNDKPTVLALREIGLGLINQSHIESGEDDIDLDRSAELALAQKPPKNNRHFIDQL